MEGLGEEEKIVETETIDEEKELEGLEVVPHISINTMSEILVSKLRG